MVNSTNAVLLVYGQLASYCTVDVSGGNAAIHSRSDNDELLPCIGRTLWPFLTGWTEHVTPHSLLACRSPTVISLLSSSFEFNNVAFYIYFTLLVYLFY